MALYVLITYSKIPFTLLLLTELPNVSLYFSGLIFSCSPPSSKGERVYFFVFSDCQRAIWASLVGADLASHLWANVGSPSWTGRLVTLNLSKTELQSKGVQGFWAKPRNLVHLSQRWRNWVSFSAVEQRVAFLQRGWSRGRQLQQRSHALPRGKNEFSLVARFFMLVVVSPVRTHWWKQNFSFRKEGSEEAPKEIQLKFN